MSAEEKKAFRRLMREREKAMSPEYIASGDAGIYENLVSLPEFAASRVIFAFCSVGAEPDTRRFISHALSLGKTVGLPVCLSGGRMLVRELKSLSELREGKYGIPVPPEDAREIAPRDIDFALIPALAFDRKGFRMGKGGGYYDRFLENSRFFAVGIVRSIFFLDSVPTEPHDARLGCIVTEKEIARPV